MSSKLCPFCMRMAEGDTCPHCGKSTNYAGSPTHLPAGYVVSGVHPYVIGAALGQGGFGITYIALDMVTGDRVAIKEYFPTFCASRTDGTVSAYPNQEETFLKGRERFLDEARVLKSLSDLKCIVNVLDFFEFNNSAYLVMEFLEGSSLKDYAAKHGRFPAQKFLSQIRPLMEDIERMHQRGVVHRDIAPDNIMLLPDGQMKLIDFGTARSFIGDRSMTVVVKKGFAPLEQYLTKGTTPSTDVYALAATIYYCITGTVPMDSAERQYDNVPLQPPSALGADTTPLQEKALAKALEIQQKARTQSVQEFLDNLNSKEADHRQRKPSAPESDDKKLDHAGSGKLPTVQKEAKKMNLRTTALVVVMAAILVIAIVVGVNQTITSSDIREKDTVAVTVGDHEISSTELNYFYIDVVNNFYSTYGAYASLLGLDVTVPLDEQVVDEATGLTWADDFLNSAKENAAATYAMADAAEAAGYTLSSEEQASVEHNIYNLDTYATLYGYTDANAYLEAIYGNGTSKDSYLEYSKRQALASSYYNYYSESLTYENADLRAKEAENYNAYSSFDYNSYYIAVSRFLEGGTTDADGNTTYTDEETAASVAAAEEAAKTLIAENIDSIEALDAAIAALPVNVGTDAASTANEDTQYNNLTDAYADWLADSSRKEGDKAYFANTSTTTAKDGTETTVTNGYYVIYYIGTNDNNFTLKNVRHILVSFSHDESEDHDHSASDYTDAEEAAAKAAAEEILNEWKSGDATEASFADLANQKSADGDGTTGGMYENIYPGQMVTNFEDWCYEAGRKSGDTGIVESPYGYHIMYFVGDSEQTYRDYQIETELRSADLEEWYTSRIDAMTITDGDTKYIRKDLVLCAS